MLLTSGDDGDDQPAVLPSASPPSQTPTPTTSPTNGGGGDTNGGGGNNTGGGNGGGGNGGGQGGGNGGGGNNTGGGGNGGGGNNTGGGGNGGGGNSTGGGNNTGGGSGTSSAVPQIPVYVFNQTTVTGLAAATAGQLEADGWNVVGVDNWVGVVPEDTVYFYPGDRAAADRLTKDIPSISRVWPASAPMPQGALTVILADGDRK
jgi:hypothetical protein